MAGDKEKEARQRAEQERVRTQQAAEAERGRGAVTAQRAEEVSAVSPAEQASIGRGFGLEQELAGFALDPQRFIEQAQPAVSGLVESLTQQAVEGPGGLIGQFQRRGLTTSGLLPEAGSRAAVQQAIGVSQLVLQRAQQNAALLRGTTADVLGRGQQARTRAAGGALQGLGLERGAQAGALQAQTGGLSRAATIEERGVQRQAESQQGLGESIGGAFGTAAQLALLLNPATAPIGASSLLAQGSLLKQAGGPLTFGQSGLSRIPSLVP